MDRPISLPPNPFALRTPEQVATQLSERLEQLRLRRGWKQSTLAERAGVSLGSLRRFEQTGQISLRNLLALAFSLDHLGDFDSVLEIPEARSLAELEARHNAPKRRRGKI